MKFVPMMLLILAATATGAGAMTRPAQIDPGRISGHIRTLASDAFEGRGPGTEGERRSLAYIVGQFRALGLRPGGEHGGWTQAVPMNSVTVSAARRLALVGPGAGCSADLAESLLVSTRNPAPHVDIAGAPLIFAGYGIVAPELGWDDYRDVDVRGKVVVVLANDPDHELDRGPFGGHAMSYYGRMPYKVEEAGRHGALAIIAVHHDAYVGQPWRFTSGSYSGPSNGLPGAADARVAFGGWLRQDQAEHLFECAGLDLERERRAAQTQGFRAHALAGMTLSARFDATTRTLVTHNVIALLPGRLHPEESFVYTAHWDHLGRGRPDSTGDTIYNGALDNAGGVAGLLELARVFAAGPRPQRSLLFIALTLEESGLLGSEYYVTHPLHPLATTVGGINMDAVNLFGPTGTMEVTGLGHTDLEDYLGAELAATGRRMQDDPNSVVGFYYRSDHFPFARAGVPFLFAGSGWELAEQRAPNTRDPQVGTRFHQPSDEWSPDLDFAAAARDVSLYYRVGLRLANSRDWPRWRRGTEFAALRARSAAQRH
jgi:Zn-dependent M28 family amino/carboxypeptidase